MRLCHGHIQVSYVPNVLNEVNGSLGCHVENVGEQQEYEVYLCLSNAQYFKNP